MPAEICVFQVLAVIILNLLFPLQWHVIFISSVDLPILKSYLAAEKVLQRAEICVLPVFCGCHFECYASDYYIYVVCVDQLH